MFENPPSVEVSIPVFYIEDFNGNEIPVCRTSEHRCKFLTPATDKILCQDVFVCSYTKKYLNHKFVDTSSKIYDYEELLQIQQIVLDNDYYFNKSVVCYKSINHFNGKDVHHIKDEIAVIKFLAPCKECPLHYNKLSTFW